MALVVLLAGLVFVEPKQPDILAFARGPLGPWGFQVGLLKKEGAKLPGVLRVAETDWPSSPLLLFLSSSMP